MKSYLLKFILFFIVLLNLTSVNAQNSNFISISEGKVNKGKLIHGKRLPYKRNNFKYFSKFSYYVLGRANVNDRVYNTVIESYKECSSSCPDVKFRVMECSRKHGGSMKPHRTHQNGLSVDFMSPLIKNDKPFRGKDRLGVWHYLLKFDNNGKLKRRKRISIEFETMARHILAVQKAAIANGLTIEKVIFKIELKDDLFNTPTGKKLKASGIYFAQALPPLINSLHDDHYHIDFKLAQ